MFHEYKRFIQNLELPFLYIFLHHNADPDAICAAEAIVELSTKISSNIKYAIYSDGINNSSKRVKKALTIQIEEVLPQDVNHSAVIITVDTGNYSQLGKYQEWVENSNLPLVMFDHHDEGELVKIAKIGINNKNYASTCILLTEGYQKLGYTPSPRISTLLLCGHIYDSRRFIYGSTINTFLSMAFLLKSGGDFDLANEFLQNEMSVSERIARLKAARRLSYNVLNNEIIVVTSNVGAFESSAARSFVNLGADVVFVIAEKKDELRGSARTRLPNRLNMSEILTNLAEEFGGTGGGHFAAAGFNVTPCISKNKQKKLLKRFVECVKIYLESHKSND